MKKKTTEEYISQCKLRHGSLYDYGNVVYKSAISRISVTCKEHGDWEVTADAHLRGNGCPLCKSDKQRLARQSSLTDWLDKFETVHGDTYDYSLTEQPLNAHSKISIKCKVHGVFSQSAANHSSGKGCPKCASHGFNRYKPGTLYIIAVDNVVKIGITNREVTERIKPISRTSGKDFTIKFELNGTGDFIADLEIKVLQELKKTFQQPREIFDGSTECFLTADINSVISTVLSLAQTL